MLAKLLLILQRNISGRHRKRYRGRRYHQRSIHNCRLYCDHKRISHLFDTPAFNQGAVPASATLYVGDFADSSGDMFQIAVPPTSLVGYRDLSSAP